MKKIRAWLKDYKIIPGKEENKNKFILLEEIPPVEILDHFEHIYIKGNMIINMFRKYSHIVNTYMEATLKKITDHNAHEEEYYVSEKIHGTNFSYLTDGKKIWEANRQYIIGDDFSYSRENIKPQIMDLFNTLKKQGATHIQVYGELFGGSYPHKDVLKSKDPRVGKGIFYHPENKWLAYDIRINGDKYIDGKYKLFKDHGIPYIKPIFKGSYEKCLNHSDKFQTTIPNYYDLPSIEDNMCEGIIITPVEYKKLGNFRVCLKKKNKTWKEKSNAPRKIKPKKVLSNNTNIAILEASKYVNDNRFANVLSKELPFTSVKQFSIFLKAFVKDALDDFISENKKIYELVEKEEIKYLKKAIGKEGATIIHEYVKKNVSEI